MSHPAPRHEAVCRDIAFAVGKRDVRIVLDALDNLPENVTARQFMRYGFESRGKNVSFANLCVDARAAEVLERVIAENAHGLTLNDLSHFRQDPKTNDREQYESLAYASVRGSYADGLRLALALEPENADLSRLHVHGTYSASLHFIALYQACGKADFKTHLVAQRACARLLRDHGAPLAVTTDLCPQGHDHPSADAFFSRKWNEDVAADLPELLREYHQAGLVDLDAPVGIMASNTADKAPLYAMLRTGCPQGAHALISMGCNLEQALDGQFEDLLSMTDSFNHPAAVRTELLAAVTEALMLRRMNAAAPTERTPGTSSRRLARAGL